jgi:hypothetical protein
MLAWPCKFNQDIRLKPETQEIRDESSECTSANGEQ